MNVKGELIDCKDVRRFKKTGEWVYLFVNSREIKWVIWSVFIHRKVWWDIKLDLFYVFVIKREISQNMDYERKEFVLQ